MGKTIYYKNTNLRKTGLSILKILLGSQKKEQFFCVCVFAFSRAAPAAYGGSQGRGTPQPKQRRILNPLSKARDQTHSLMVLSHIHYH